MRHRFAGVTWLFLLFVVAAASTGCRGGNPQVGRLVDRLGEPGSETQKLEIVRQIEKYGRTAVPQLADALGSDNEFIRGYAAVALGGIGPEAAEAVPGLLPLFEDRYGKVRMYAVQAVGQIGAAPPGTIPALVACLDMDYAPLRYHAVNALWKLGPAAAEAAPALEEHVDDPDPLVAQKARETLERTRKRGEAGTP